VLFLEVRDSRGQLAQLAGAVDAAFEALGLPREQRPFHAHLTLARVRGAPDSAPLHTLAPSGAGADAGTANVRDVTLYRSDLLRAGAEYHVLARHRLSGPEVSSGGAAPA
jgi:2'-5' RNA ligase